MLWRIVLVSVKSEEEDSSGNLCRNTAVKVAEKVVVTRRKSPGAYTALIPI